MIEYFPDGTIIDNWFYEYTVPNLESLGKKYILTDYSIKDDGNIYTKEIQSLIELAHENGGGVIIVPKGTYMSGSLFFKNGVNLYISKDGVLKGSDNPCDYVVKETRIEGETCNYLTALINADRVDNFNIIGDGIIDGNGMRSWSAFWHRRKWNPKCTNKDEQRPRLVYISNSSNITISGIKLMNSHFWTSHLYKCDHIKYLNCKFYSPCEPVKAPSTDAIDIDVCHDVLVKNCYLEVNDDAIALKGGKGVFADKDINNGANERIIIEDCEYGFCHSCLTCGSEAIHNKNIIMRRVDVKEGKNLLWLKMRPDTPQLYEFINIDNVKANVSSFININPWTQFFNLGDQTEMLKSIAKNIIISNCDCNCITYFNVKKSTEQYELKDFKFENLNIICKNSKYIEDAIEDLRLENVNITIKQ